LIITERARPDTLLPSPGSTRDDFGEQTNEFMMADPKRALARASAAQRCQYPCGSARSPKETVYDYQGWQHHRSKQRGAPEPGNDAEACPWVQETALWHLQRFALKPEGNESQ
jgi:hypothetical protein